MSHSMSSQQDSFKTVSLEQWWSESSRIPLLDTRSQEEYNIRCLDASNAQDKTTIVHIPLDQLQERSYELPPRNLPFAVLVSDLSSHDFLYQLFCGTHKTNQTDQKRQQRPWQVPYRILANVQDNWEQAKRLGILSDDSSSLASSPPLPRLWQPDDMVQTLLLPRIRQKLQEQGGSGRSEIWDLGSGAGRDVCFLAEECLGHLVETNSRFVGFDQRYPAGDDDNNNPVRLDLWKRRHLSHVCEGRKVDLRSIDEFRKQLIEHSSSDDCCSTTVLCIYAVRFWNRTLVEYIAGSDLLRSGTIFGISHFGKPYEGAPWNFDHPKERNVLNRNELRDIFTDAGTWKIQNDSIKPDGDHGRTLIQFVATRI